MKQQIFKDKIQDNISDIKIIHRNTQLQEYFDQVFLFVTWECLKKRMY